MLKVSTSKLTPVESSIELIVEPMLTIQSSPLDGVCPMLESNTTSSRTLGVLTGEKMVTSESLPPMVDSVSVESTLLEFIQLPTDRINSI